MLIEINNISKRFGATLALHAVSATFESGQVYSLVGENGAGKSTLGKIIAGVYQPSEGALLFDGAEVNFQSPAEALDRGVTIIAQELSLIPAKSVIENVFLGIESSVGPFVNSAQDKVRFKSLVEETHIFLDPNSVVSALRTGDQQKVEILRALARNAQVIVMDEPTARLSASETQNLKSLILKLKSQGKTIIFISHFLTDVLDISDHIVIMRDGNIIRISNPGVETHDSLVEAMTGAKIGSTFPPKRGSATDKKVILQVNNLSRSGVFSDISFNVSEGEIVVLAGLVGSGRTEVARAIFGADPHTTGEVKINGKVVHLKSPADAIAAGIAMIPESRKDQGIIPTRPLRDNISLPHLNLLSIFGFIKRTSENSLVQRFISSCGVRASGLMIAMTNLSGGNQQKALFARSLAGSPILFIADEPTRGVDVGSKRAIYQLISEQADNNLAILIISSELDEVVGLADRVLVMRQGRIVKELSGTEVSENSVVAAAFIEMGSK